MSLIVETYRSRKPLQIKSNCSAMTFMGKKFSYIKIFFLPAVKKE